MHLTAASPLSHGGVGWENSSGGKSPPDVIIRRTVRFSFRTCRQLHLFRMDGDFFLWKKSQMLIVSADCWSQLLCYSRIYLGVHYPGDILCGLILGSCWSIWQFFLRCWKSVFSRKKNNFQKEANLLKFFLLLQPQNWTGCGSVG